MADKSYNEIQNLNEDWGLDTRNGNPYSGQSVQAFIKKYLTMANEHNESKVGDAYFDPSENLQYLFNSTEDKLAWINGDTSVSVKVCPFEFSGTVRRMTIENLMGSKSLYYTQKSEQAIISIGYKSEEKGISDSSWSENDEDAYVTVEVDRGFTGKFTTIVSDQLVLNGNIFSVDVFKYLATADNRVRISVVGVETGVSSNITYNVLVTSMYLAPANFRWNIPFIEGRPYSLGGLYIGGSIDKVLKIKVYNEQTYKKEYEPIRIGTDTYTNTAYSFGGLLFPTEGTGIYTVEMWLDANGLESEHLSYNIMCVSATEANTAKLVTVSNVLPEVKNYDTNKIFSYAVYNGGASKANPVVNVSAIVHNTPTSIVKNQVLDNVETGAINDYILELELDSQESDIKLYASIELGECKQEAVYEIDNSASFPAVSGAIFYMNPASRNNAQNNRTMITNDSNLSVATAEYTATWTNVSFTDGMDGWTVDNQGRSCLRLPATSKVEIDYAPLYNATTRTIELSYRVENASDYNEDVITIASDLTSRFIGVRVKPTNVVLHSGSLTSDDILQGYNTKDEELVHLLITIIQDYKKIGNLAQIYVNGVKKCSFEWSNQDSFAHNGKMIFGSNTADLYIYKVRVYQEVQSQGTSESATGAFDWIKASQNFISCLPDTQSKKVAHAKLKSVINDGNKIDFDKVKDGGFNYFTLRLPNGEGLPSIQHQDSVPHTRLEINIQQNPSFVINGIYDDEETEGQGTTAMNYFRWNLRWKTDRIRITAKKNFASSMHSHKMGATALFNDLHQMIVGPNEVGGRVAVEQYGAYGFIEVLKEGTTDQYDYIPIGLYTIGQDKGDKATFGYNNKDYKSTLIHLEGTDHSPRAVGMDYPWSGLSVATNEEGDANLGVRKDDGSVAAAWEIGACGTAETDQEMFSYLTEEFKPAYDVDYLNTSMLVALDRGTSIDSVNANLSNFRATETDNGFTNANCLVWIDGEYETYYYDELQGKYVKDGVNILTDLGITESDLTGTTAMEKNREVRLMRMQRYRSTMENFWHLRDSLFHYCFIVLFAATDNFKKNTYPYKFGTLTSGSRWRWRQDDLDTLFDINNQGLANKMYSIINGDKSGTTHLFRGNTSYHWTNIQFYYENEIKSMMREILTAMASLSNTGGSLIEKAVGCVRKYFWDKAQDYFTKSAYNLDAEWTYEEAWAATKNGSYNPSVLPLQQSLGDHYEAERAFVELRFIFMASLYGFGAFAVGSDKDVSLGQISFRPAQGDNTYQLTPAINMNPTILIGDSDSKSANTRLLAGEEAEITISTDGDTPIYIQGADYLSDIGDFSQVNLYADNPQLVVQSKRLQRLKVGDADATRVKTLLKTLTVLPCPSLSEVDARNAVELEGTIDLSQCPRLRRALFGGTKASEIAIPKGSKIEELELPDSTKILSLLNLPKLTEEGLTTGELSALTYLRVENNANIDGYGLLKATIGNGAKIKNIRIIGFDYEGNSTDADLLAELARKDESGNPIYGGIKPDGTRDNSIIPVIEGKLRFSTPIYEDSFNALQSAYGEKLILDTIGGYYIRFADPEVLRVLLSKNIGDGTGITKEVAESYTGNMTSFFNNNTAITSFNELEKFTSMTYIGYMTFSGASNLTSVTFPPNIEEIGWDSFRSTSKLAIDVSLPNLKKAGERSFYGSGITKISDLGSLAAIPNSMCSSCNQLTSVTLPDVCVEIGASAFPGTTALTSINLDNIETFGNSCFDASGIGGDLNLPKAKSIGNYAFRGTSITSVKTTSIGTGAFANCKSLEYADLSNPAITIIFNNAFYGCSLLSKVEFSPNIESIAGASFYNCTSLVGTMDLPNLKVLGNFAFQNTGITGIIAPKLETIGEGCFYGSKIIGEINFPYLKGELGSESFRGTKITKILSLGEVETLKTNFSFGAFASCTVLTEVLLPSTIKDIQKYSFRDCLKLEKVVVEATIPPSLGLNVFWETPATMSIYVPDQSLNAYRTADNWSAYADRIKPFSEYQE